MENRFEQNPPEEQQGWGAYATPPPISGQFRTDPASQLTPQASLCARVRDILPHLVENDGDIRPETAREVYSHLSTCSGCARELDEMQHVVAALESLGSAEMPIDFSNIIMQRIESPGLSREAYKDRIAAVQNSVGLGLSQESELRRRQTSNGASPQASYAAQSAHSVRTAAEISRSQLRTAGVQNVQQQSIVSIVQRVVAAAVLTSILVVLVSTSWGRELLGQNVSAARTWLSEIGDAVQGVPLLGRMTAYIVASLSQNVEMLGETYRTLGATAVQGLILDAGLCAAAYYMLNARKSRGSVRRL